MIERYADARARRYDSYVKNAAYTREMPARTPRYAMPPPCCHRVMIATVAVITVTYARARHVYAYAHEARH